MTDNNLPHQDWTPVVFEKKDSSNTKSKGRHVDPNVIKMAKIDNAEDIIPIKKVADADRKLIVSLRLEKKLSQENLAKKLNIDKSVIRDLEAGKLTENKQLTNRIKNLLQKLPTPTDTNK